MYEQEGVPYYLILDPQFKKIELYELKDGKYQPGVVSLSAVEFTLRDGCQFSVNLENIWD
ncbi:MAG: Uma2 family endonuclease [Chitinophagaceae bacterium]